MKRFLPALMACIATCIVVTPAVSAASSQSRIASAATTHIASADTSANGAGSSHTKVRAAPKGQSERNQPAAAKTAKTVAPGTSRHDIAEARKAAALEQAQARERTDDIYAASQTDAPIIVGAKACRRVGANGESIYENC